MYHLVVMKNYLLFDVYQLNVYGGSFHEAKSFDIRFYIEKKLAFFNSIFIPYGPVVKDTEGFKECLIYLNKYKFSKITLELPLILDKNLKEDILKTLEKFRYKETNYIHDNGTRLINKANLKVNSRNMRYVRQGLKRFEIKILENLNDIVISEIYNLYKLSAKMIGYNPKSRNVVETIAKNSITSIAISKETGKVHGFLMGYKGILPSSDFSKKGEFIEILQLIFTGLSHEARESKVGFALHYNLFEYIFDQGISETIDFHGAGQNQNRSYVGFKEAFGGEFIEYPGAFSKINLL